MILTDSDESSVGRAKAAEGLKDAVQSAQHAAVELLGVLKNKGGTASDDMEGSARSTRLEGAFHSTCRNTANLIILLEQMEDLINEMD